MAAPGPWTLYNDAKLSFFLKKHDLSADALKVALVLSTSNAISATMTPATYASITNEVAGANGYTTGGVAVSGNSVTGGGATATITFDTGDATFTASGAGIAAARAAVLYNNTATNKDLIAFCLLDSTPADISIAAGNSVVLQITNVFTNT